MDSCNSNPKYKGMARERECNIKVREVPSYLHKIIKEGGARGVEGALQQQGTGDVMWDPCGERTTAHRSEEAQIGWHQRLPI